MDLRSHFVALDYWAAAEDRSSLFCSVLPHTGGVLPQAVPFGSSQHAKFYNQTKQQKLGLESDEFGHGLFLLVVRVSCARHRSVRE